MDPAGVVHNGGVNRYNGTSPEIAEQVMNRDNVAEANRLYWETDRPVAEIAESLDLSRRALYEAVQPIQADTACAVCGTMMHYANRSARDTRQSTCYTCATSSPQEPPAREAEAWTWSPAVPQDGAAASPSSDLRDRAWRLGSAALLGAVIGAAATHLLLRRD